MFGQKFTPIAEIHTASRRFHIFETKQRIFRFRKMLNFVPIWLLPQLKAG